jgi:hypothetical protein
LTKFTKEKIKDLILETVQSQKPENTQSLVEIIQHKTPLTTGEITSLLNVLETEGKLKFHSTSVPSTPLSYFLSRYATWFWAVIAIVLATITTVLSLPNDIYPIVYFRSTLAIVFVLFLPGYTFIKMLFPSCVPIKTSSENLDKLECIALSFGSSIAIVATIGMALNFSPWGIKLVPSILSLMFLTGVFASLAIVREYNAKQVIVRKVSKTKQLTNSNIGKL